MSNAHFETSTIEFNINSQEIDYYKIPVEGLQKDGYTVNYHPIDLSEEYLSLENHLNNINHDIRETIILNIQVGKGKTKTCYDLIEYYSKNDFLVIVVSPFKKLVEKDYASLLAKGLSPFHYEGLKEAEHIEEYIDEHGELFDITPSPFLNSNIQVMTVNCLLQNPGEDKYAQAADKKGYIKQLLEMCENEERKVVFFFDEIHESISNFQSEFVPNLFKWATVAHKCYISSATYTPASIPVIKYIASLALAEISVYETPRKKIAEPVSLHIHLTEDRYSTSLLAPIKHIKDIIANNSRKSINILTGYKSIAESFINPSDTSTDFEIKNAIHSLSPNLITGDEDNPFDEARNNLGTAFKTGIDIQNNDSIFIIILPCLTESNTDYGIFTDGIPSIIQSMARLRKKGQLHIFMYAPSTLIDLGDNNQSVENQLKVKDTIPPKKQNDSFTELNSFYLTEKEKVNVYIEHLTEIQKPQNGGYDLGYTYPSFGEFLIKRSQGLMVKHHYQYGKELSSYILWAAINNQFTNATLSEITYTGKKTSTIVLNNENIVEYLESIMADKKEILKNMKLLQGLEYILEQLKKSDDNSEVYIEYKNQSKTRVKNMWKSTDFMQSLINYFISVVTNGKLTSITKQDYVLACCIQSSLITNSDISQLSNGYKQLNDARNHFINNIAKSIYQTRKLQNAIDVDTYKLIPDNFITSYIQAIRGAYVNDPLFKYKIFSSNGFLGTITDISKFRKRIYNEYANIFTNISSVRTTSSNDEKEKGLIIDGQIDKTPSAELLALNLL